MITTIESPNDDWREMPLWVVLALDKSAGVPNNWRDLFERVFIYGYDKQQSADVCLTSSTFHVSR